MAELGSRNGRPGARIGGGASKISAGARTFPASGGSSSAFTAADARSCSALAAGSQGVRGEMALPH